MMMMIWFRCEGIHSVGIKVCVCVCDLVLAFAVCFLEWCVCCRVVCVCECVMQSSDLTYVSMSWCLCYTFLCVSFSVLLLGSHVYEFPFVVACDAKFCVCVLSLCGGGVRVLAIRSYFLCVLPGVGAGGAAQWWA